MTLHVDATKSFSEVLVNNLKALNAKERDHLMRFAYLGETARYDETACWLSESMTTALQEQLVGTRLEGKKPACVFAAMDYHLDWLHAALVLTCHGPELEVEQRRLCTDSSWTWPTLQPVIGIQEDLDLLVVFADQQDTVVFCIEAKGVSSFNKKQLARKLIRLDRILLASDAYAHSEIEFKFVLVAPDKPGFEECRLHANAGTDSLMDKYEGGRHKVAIGCGMNFVELKGFPTTLKKVTRTGAAKAYTHWKIVNRRDKTL